MDRLSKSDRHPAPSGCIFRAPADIQVVSVDDLELTRSAVRHQQKRMSSSARTTNRRSSPSFNGASPTRSAVEGTPPSRLATHSSRTTISTHTGTPTPRRRRSPAAHRTSGTGTPTSRGTPTSISREQYLSLMKKDDLKQQLLDTEGDLHLAAEELQETKIVAGHLDSIRDRMAEATYELESKQMSLEETTRGVLERLIYLGLIQTDTPGAATEEMLAEQQAILHLKSQVQLQEKVSFATADLSANAGALVDAQGRHALEAVGRSVVADTETLFWAFKMKLQDQIHTNSNLVEQLDATRKEKIALQELMERREESLQHTRELLQAEREAVSELHNKLESASHQTLKARKDKLDVQLILANHAKEVLDYTQFVEKEMKKKLGYVPLVISQHTFGQEFGPLYQEAREIALDNIDVSK